MSKNTDKRSILCCIILVLSLAVTACGNFSTVSNPLKKTATTTDNTENQQSLSGSNDGYGKILAAYGISIPQSSPSIYVDEAGYEAGREKKVMFAGERHGKTFDVVRSVDGEVVYTGTIAAGTKDEMTGLIFSTGDFTAVDEPGTYYIRTDIVGESYPFRIAEDSYEKLFLNMLRDVSNAGFQEGPEGVCDVCFGMHAIMHALQCNGSLFEAAYEQLAENEQDRQLVAQLLYMAKWLMSQQKDDGSLYGDYEATAAFCGIMAMSRDHFGKYETSVGKEYQQACMKAWKWLEGQKNDTDVTKNAQFYAAAQLFRSTNDGKYKKIAEDYLKDRKENYSEEQFVFYGVLAYISAEKGTDRDLCTSIMRDMVERTESICKEVKEDSLFGTGTRTIEDNVSNMLHLSFVNYLTPSKEYTVIIENTIQYMGGLNESGICYMGADGKWNNAAAVNGRSFEWNGIVLLGMSDMLRNFSEAEM